MTFEKTALRQDMDDIHDAEAITEHLNRHMDDAEIMVRRDMILGIVEENINENGTVSRYDIARINEVMPESSNLRHLGTDEQVAGALNAIGEGKGGIFRLVIGLLMGIAGIGMMVYGFLQQHKEADKTIQSIRDATEAIKKNAKVTFTNINMSAKPVVTKEVTDLYAKMGDLWWQSTGDGADDLPKDPLAWIKDPIYPWSQNTKKVRSIVTTQLWQGDAGKLRELKRGMEIITKGLVDGVSKVDKYFDDLTGHLTKGEALPKNFDDPEVMFYIKNPFGGDDHLLSSLRGALLERAQMAWPLRYKESEWTQSVQTYMTGMSKAFQLTSYLHGGKDVYIADACTHVFDMNDKCADHVKTISELSTKMAKRLKVLEDSAKNGLSKLEGMDRGNYNVILKKINVQINELNELNEVVNRTLINGTMVAERIKSFLGKMVTFDDLGSKMQLAARIAGTEAANKGAGNNAFGLAGLNDDVDGYSRETTRIYTAAMPVQTTAEVNHDDDMPTAIIAIEDELGLEQYVRDIDFELESIDKLQAIAERISDAGVISRSDVAEIESAAPGLMALLPDQPNFTFRPSTVGLDAGLNAIGSKISAKGGVLGAIIAAILAVIGFIIAKIFGGEKGAGKESGGIQTPPPEVMEVNDQARAEAAAMVNAAREEKHRKDDELKRKLEREKEELKAKEQRAKELGDTAAAADAARELKAAEEEAKAKLAEYNFHQRELRIRHPKDLAYMKPDDPYIYSVDKADSHLDELVLKKYREVITNFGKHIDSGSHVNKNLSVTWLLETQPSIFAYLDGESVNRYYNSFIYAPDAVKRVVDASNKCVEVGRRIYDMSQRAHIAHKSAEWFWLHSKPRGFRTMDDFNRAMERSGLGKALAKLKEHSQTLADDATTLSTVRATLKYDYIDVTKPETILSASPIPVQMDAINSEYKDFWLPMTVRPFQSDMDLIRGMMDKEKRHQSYDGGMREGGGFYLANNVYGTAGIGGDNKGGRGVNLKLRKELMEDGMPAEVFAAIARVEREHVDFINQAHRRIQGAVNAAAYITGDMRSYYENAVRISERNVSYQKKLAEFSKVLKNKE